LAEQVPLTIDEVISGGLSRLLIAASAIIGGLAGWLAR
jgi:hypothetical protein